MKKEELIAKLTGVKEYTNTVSIDFVLAALGMLEESTPSLFNQELADEISVEDMRSIALDLRSKIKDGIVVRHSTFAHADKSIGDTRQH